MGCWREYWEGEMGRAQMWFDNKVRELIAVKVLFTSSMNITVSPSEYFPWEAMHQCQCLVHPSKQFWNLFCAMDFRAPDVISVIKMPSFQYFLYLQEQKKVTGGTCTNISLISLPLLTSLTRNLMFICCSNSSSDILATADQNTLTQ
jgi:hypothetical protein